MKMSNNPKTPLKTYNISMNVNGTGIKAQINKTQTIKLCQAKAKLS